jgi:hypothetical protein
MALKECVSGRVQRPVRLAFANSIRHDMRANPFDACASDENAERFVAYVCHYTDASHDNWYQNLWMPARWR